MNAGIVFFGRKHIEKLPVERHTDAKRIGAKQRKKSVVISGAHTEAVAVPSEGERGHDHGVEGGGINGVFVLGLGDPEGARGHKYIAREELKFATVDDRGPGDGARSAFTKALDVDQHLACDWRENPNSTGTCEQLKQLLRNT